MSEFNIFQALTAIDNKNYDYLKSLPEEEQKKFSPYMMMQWMSSVTGNSNVQEYFVQGANYANQHYLNDPVSKHPLLQWQLLCAASPNIGKQRHQWIPSLPKKVTDLKEKVKAKDAKEYFSKVGGNATDYAEKQHKQVYLASEFPNMKIEDIQALSEMITQEDIDGREKEKGS